VLPLLLKAVVRLVVDWKVLAVVLIHPVLHKAQSSIDQNFVDFLLDQFIRSQGVLHVDLVGVRILLLGGFVSLIFHLPMNVPDLIYGMEI